MNCHNVSHYIAELWTRCLYTAILERSPTGEGLLRARIPSISFKDYRHINIGFTLLSILSNTFD